MKRYSTRYDLKEEIERRSAENIVDMYLDHIQVDICTLVGNKTGWISDNPAMADQRLVVLRDDVNKLRDAIDKLRISYYRDEDTDLHLEGED